MGRKPGPTFEGMFAGNDQLGIRKFERCVLNVCVGHALQAGVVSDTRHCFWSAVGEVLQQIFRLFLVLLEVGASRKHTVGHEKLLSIGAGVRNAAGLKEVSYCKLLSKRWARPFPRTGSA